MATQSSAAHSIVINYVSMKLYNNIVTNEIQVFLIDASVLMVLVLDPEPIKIIRKKFSKKMEYMAPMDNIIIECHVLVALYFSANFLKRR